MKHQMLKVLTVCLLTLSFVSCKKEKDPPANEIEDATGLSTTLTFTNAINDLDIYLWKGTGTSKTVTAYYSDGSTTTENFVFPSNLADGDYTISVDFYDIQANGNLNFAFKAASGTKTYNISNIAFTTANDGQENDLIKITKSGNKFTITKL